MDRCTKRVLKYMLKTNPGKAGHCMFIYFYDACVEATGLTEHQIMASIRQLHSDGYIAYVPDQRGVDVGFEFENKAYHRFHYKWEDVRSFLFKSVLVPVAVSLVTNLIAIWLTQ